MTSTERRFSNSRSIIHFCEWGVDRRGRGGLTYFDKKVPFLALERGLQ